MKLNLDATPEAKAHYVNFTHVRDGENFHIYIKLEDIKCWESVAMSGTHDRATRWCLTTVQGDVYYTLNNFNEIMTTCILYPRSSDGQCQGRVPDRYLYQKGE